MLPKKKKKAKKPYKQPKTKQKRNHSYKNNTFSKDNITKNTIPTTEWSINTAKSSPRSTGNVSGCCKSLKALKCFTELFPGDTDSLSATQGSSLWGLGWPQGWWLHLQLSRGRGGTGACLCVLKELLGTPRQGLGGGSLAQGCGCSTSSGHTPVPLGEGTASACLQEKSHLRWALVGLELFCFEGPGLWEGYPAPSPAWGSGEAGAGLPLEASRGRMQQWQCAGWHFCAGSLRLPKISGLKGQMQQLPALPPPVTAPVTSSAFPRLVVGQCLPKCVGNKHSGREHTYLCPCFLWRLFSLSESTEKLQMGKMTRNRRELGSQSMPCSKKMEFTPWHSSLSGLTCQQSSLGEQGGVIQTSDFPGQSLAFPLLHNCMQEIQRRNKKSFE